MNQALRDQIIALAARPTGATMDDLCPLADNERQISNVIYDLKRQEKLSSFRRGMEVVYFADLPRMQSAKAEWDAGQPERERQRERAKAARRKERAKAAIAAGVIQPRPPAKPRAAKPAPKPIPKLAKAAPVTVKASTRGPAYLPGEPIFTPQTIYTYGRNHVAPTHTNTHSEIA